MLTCPLHVLCGQTVRTTSACLSFGHITGESFQIFLFPKMRSVPLRSGRTSEAPDCTAYHWENHPKHQRIAIRRDCLLPKAMNSARSPILVPAAQCSTRSTRSARGEARQAGLRRCWKLTPRRERLEDDWQERTPKFSHTRWMAASMGSGSHTHTCKAKRQQLCRWRRLCKIGSSWLEANLPRVAKLNVQPEP